MLFHTAAILAGLLITRAAAQEESDLVVKTNHFTIQGIVEPDATNVRTFRRVPYAEAPVGEKRFKPPVTKKDESKVLDGTQYGPSCIQLNTGQPTAYTELLSGFLPAPGAIFDEDCLSLIIWAPRAPINQSLPVLIYIPGGGFTSGGANSQYKYGANIVRNHQDVIVISMNYRLNIFGYPNAARLNKHDLNPGLLDQRKAVEWVSENIAAFGGDPSRITLWGNSAGGSSVDKYAYAWPTEPLVQGLIAHSGTAGLLGQSASDTSNFTYVAQQVGCAQDDPDDSFVCMQGADAQDIIGVLNRYNASDNGGQSLSFVPAGDNETSFDDYTDMESEGKFARLPLLVGNNDHEFATLLPYSPNGPNETLVQQQTQSAMTCPAGKAAQSRTTSGVPAWRYRYFGQFPNLNPMPWLGAYHSSELPMVFGTSDLLGPNTELESETSSYMQQAWLAFVKDPVGGLLEYGWPKFNESTVSLVKLGSEGNVSAVLALGDAYDKGCT